MRLSRGDRGALWRRGRGPAGLVRLAAQVAKARLGGELGLDGPAWACIAKRLPDPRPGDSGGSAAIDSLHGGESRVVRFVVAWSAPEWNAGGYHWAGARTYAHVRQALSRRTKGGPRRWRESRGDAPPHFGLAASHLR